MLVLLVRIIKQFFIPYKNYHNNHNYIYIYIYMLCIKYLYSNFENILCFDIKLHMYKVSIAVLQKLCLSYYSIVCSYSQQLPSIHSSCDVGIVSSSVSVRSNWVVV